MPSDPRDIQRIALICTGSSCTKAGARELAHAAERHLKKHDLKPSTRVLTARCHKLCKLAPVFSLQPDNAWHHSLPLPEAQALLLAHLDAPLPPPHAPLTLLPTPKPLKKKKSKKEKKKSKNKK
jgi:(2Fe-2S) ferredoxin